MRIKTLLIILLILLSGFFYYQCSDTSQKIKPLSKNSTILAIGDSITSGVGTSPENAYPEQLQRLSGYQVINAGISGNASAETLQRLPAPLKEYQPKLVIILIGGNDFIKKKNIAELINNIKVMISMSRTQGAQVILIGVPETSLAMRVPDFYREIAEQYSIPFNDTILRKLLRDKKYKSDTVHLNAQGYLELAKAINQMLK